MHLPILKLRWEALDSSQNGDASTGKEATFPLLTEEIQKKPRRRVVTALAEENV
ncbi:hypothetical protein [Bartonella vinsonii]|uniref:hypothetical protein n=1 Tax=Bartonella vinsonii TaxID=33047 RepID=UPI0013DF78C6|nr:hypothetical protein [Bartonella vinsonii]